jgi:hypothetical protein
VKAFFRMEQARMGRRFARRFAVSVLALAVVAASFALLSYSRWAYEITKGNRALAAEDYPAAERAYSAAAASALTNVRSTWRRLVFNRARSLYAMREYDAMERMLEAATARVPALAEDPEYHFWMGNVQYRKAIAETDKDALRAALERASDSFRLGLASAPDDWDLKYNYELTARLLAGMRNKKDDKTEKLKRGEMKILREDSEKSKEPQQKLSPAKRS